MNKFLPIICAAAGMLVTAMTPAQAQSFSVNAAVTNNYVWRGITQSDEDFAVQGGADVEFDNGLAFGAWGSTVDFNDGDTSFEVDLYGSYTHAFTEMFSGTVGAIGYLYPNQPSGADYNFVEFFGGLEVSADPATLSGTVYYSPDVGGLSTWYFTGGPSIAVGEYFEIFGNVGYWSWEGGFDATDFNLGATASYMNFSLTGMYADSDAPGSDGYFIALLSVSFP